MALFPHESDKDENKVSDFRAGSRSHVVSVETVEALKSGDHTAFREVYVHYWGPLLGFIRSLIGSEEEAKEITQDIFLILWEKRETIDSSKNIKSYIYTIARNSAIKYFDHRKVLNRYADASRHDAEGMFSAASDELVIEKEINLLKDIVVSRMPKQRRQVFEMSRDEGLSNDEIALRLDINKTAVASHLHQARKEIKDMIKLFMILLMVQ